MYKSEVLILGSSGLLGHSLCHYLGESGVAFRGISRGSHPHLDFNNRAQIHKLLDELKPKFVINLIALANVDQCEENYAEAYKVNVDIAICLSDWVRNNPESWMIHISTDMVYDGEELNSEESAVVISNNYCKTKLMAEENVKQSNVTILRTNFFGRSFHPNTKSFSDWLYQAYINKTQIQLVEDVFFSPLSMKTLGRAIERVMASPAAGIFNLGSHDGLSKAEFGRRFAENLGIDISEHVTFCNIGELPLKAKRSRGMLMDVTKFERVFDFKLPSLLEEISSLKGEYNEN